MFDITVDPRRYSAKNNGGGKIRRTIGKAFCPLSFSFIDQTQSVGEITMFLTDFVSINLNVIQLRLSMILCGLTQYSTGLLRKPVPENQNYPPF
jgi:hypothetical protein